MDNYRATTQSGHVFYFDADLTHASSPLYGVSEDGERLLTPFQTADVHHNQWAAAEWVGEYFDDCSDEDPVVSVTAEDDEDSVDEDAWFGAMGSVESVSMLSL